MSLYRIIFLERDSQERLEEAIEEVCRIGTFVAFATPVSVTSTVYVGVSTEQRWNCRLLVRGGPGP